MEDFIRLFTSPNVSNTCILITIFYLDVFRAMFMNVLILIVAVFKINMNKNGVKYFTGHHFFSSPHLTPAEKTD
jgi:uncharacterized membrane protein YdfJ with MMPL/SSD domain